MPEHPQYYIDPPLIGSRDNIWLKKTFKIKFTNRAIPNAPSLWSLEYEENMLRPLCPYTVHPVCPNNVAAGKDRIKTRSKPSKLSKTSSKPCKFSPKQGSFWQPHSYIRKRQSSTTPTPQQPNNTRSSFSCTI